MAEQSILIVGADRLDGNAVVVEFSDGTFAVVTIENILELYPVRETVPRENDAA